MCFSNKSLQNSYTVFFHTEFIIAKASLFGVHFEMLLPIAQEEVYKKTGNLITMKTHQGRLLFHNNCL